MIVHLRQLNRENARVFLLCCLGYVVAATLNAWPIPALLPTHLPHDLGDPVLGITLLQWNATVPWFSRQWWDGPGFYPLTDTLTFSDPRLGLSLMATPIIWLTGSVVAAYNVIFITSFVLSAVAAHLLVFSLTRSHLAAAVAGCAYGFAPYRAAHLAHLELLASFWMPLALWSLHRWLQQRTMRWLVMLTLSLAGQGLFCAYYLPMFGVFIGLWMLWFAVGRVGLGQLGSLVAAAILGAAALAPMFLHYHRAHERMALERGIGEIEMYSADVAGLWSAAPELRVWPSVPAKNTEGYLFPGLTIVLLVLAGAWRSRSATVQTRPIQRLRHGFLIAAALIGLVLLISLAIGPWRFTFAGVSVSVSHFRKPLSLVIAALAAYAVLHPRITFAARSGSVLGFYALAAILMFVLAFGPAPTILGVKFLYKAPYAWLMSLPGFDQSLRVPARFGMLAALALSVAAGIAWSRLLDGRRPRLARSATVAVALLIVAEGWSGPLTAHVPPQAETWPARCAGLPRFELPFAEIADEAAAQYRAVLARTRSVNGESGFSPPHLLALAAAIDTRDSDALTALAEHGPLCISVNPSRREAAGLARWISGHWLARSLSNDRFFLVRRASAPRVPSPGDRLTIKEASSHVGPVDRGPITDGDRVTAWISNVHRHHEHLTLTLGCSATVTQVGLSQGGHILHFAGGLAVEVSSDGSFWRTAWQGTTGGLTVRAALRDPRMVPTYFPIGVVDVRHVRLRLIQALPDAPWAVADVSVHGHCGP